MTTSGTPSTCEILYVDDEEKALKYFRMAFAAKYTIHIASSAKEGLEILRQQPGKIGIVVSDQRMPEMLGAEFLGRVREEFPQIIRILTTAYSDLESAIEAVNRGHIYQYVVKPWEVKDFGMVLQRAADYHHVLSERNELLSLKMSTLQRILSGDRLVWLKLFLDSLEPARRRIHERTLTAYVKALPHPARFWNSSPGTAHFDAPSILHGEYENAAKTIAALTQMDRSLMTADLRDQSLQDLSAALVGKYGLSPEEIKVKVGGDLIDVQIRPARITDLNALTFDLFGLLIERTASDCSLAFFRALLAVAGVGGQLNLSLGNSDGTAESANFKFQLGENLPTQELDLIDALYEKVSRWDVADR